MELTKIKKLITEKIDGERVKITSEMPQFSLRRYEGELTPEGAGFLKEINQTVPEKLKIGTGLSGCYRFKLGQTAIELDIYHPPENRKKIEIQPYLIYHTGEIHRDTRKIIMFCFLLSSYLKNFHLQ